MRSHSPLKRALVVLLLLSLGACGCIWQGHRESLARIENWYGARGVRPGSMPLWWDVSDGPRHEIVLPEELR